MPSSSRASARRLRRKEGGSADSKASRSVAGFSSSRAVREPTAVLENSVSRLRSVTSPGCRTTQNQRLWTGIAVAHRSLSFDGGSSRVHSAARSLQRQPQEAGVVSCGAGKVAL
eukprot:scaffold4708_cov75-Phaeocystis_antarctica.AAC.4